MNLKTLDEKSLEKILDLAILDEERGLGKNKLNLTAEARSHLFNTANGDARRLLNNLELVFLATTENERGEKNISLADLELAIQKRALRYDKKGDEHYDIISAFIKSMRGSNPDAALYWMAKMLKAGEDPRFIARRIMIFAAEDVGNADPVALALATAAAKAVETIGMPEARIPLAQAVTYVSCAPKSNASYLAIEKAMAEVENGPHREVPIHLKDASQDGEKLGHGQGYEYPHSFPGHFVKQIYMPDPVEFYEPTEQGIEKDIKKRLEEWRKRSF